MTTIKWMNNDEDILKCYPLMATLRTSLNDPNLFLKRIQRQQQQGYQLLALMHSENIVALAGYRYLENLIHDQFIYIDDLITDPAFRGRKFGAQLFNIIAQEAQRNAYDHIILDSGSNNTSAHRFYNRQGMVTKAIHFSMDLTQST